MANDREFIIEALINQNKIVKAADIDMTTTYLQLGVWQKNQRQSGGSDNAYPSYVIPLSALIGSGGTYFGDETTIHLGAGNIFSFVSMNISQFTNNSGYITNSAISISPNVIPKGTGTGITNGTWLNIGADILPTVSGNIGDPANRISTLFMSSTVDYTSTLNWISSAVTQMALTPAGKLSIGTAATVIWARVNIQDSLNLTNTIFFDNSNTFIRGDSSGFLGYTDPRKMIIASADGNLLYYVDGNINLAAHRFITLPNGGGTPLERFTIRENGYINAGFAVFTPTAKFHIKGENTLAAQFALKVENSAANLYNTTNNGEHRWNSYFDGGGGTPNYQFDSSSGLLIKLKSTGAAIVWEEAGVNGLFSNAGGFAQMLFTNRFTLKNFIGDSKLWMDNANGFIGIGNVYFGATSQLHVSGDAYIQNGTIGAGVAPSGFYSVRALTTIRTETGDLQTVANGSGVLWNGSGFSRIISDSSFNFLGGFANYYFGDSNSVNDLAITYSATKAKLGVGILLPTAKTHIVGLNSASTDFALKIDSSTLPQIYIRNDNRISIPSVQTGNAGLVTGDIYVDTAANVLANADLVVARKV